MATQVAASAERYIGTPSGVGENFVTYSATQPVIIQVGYTDSEDQQAVENIAAPAGTHYLYVQHRKCGDWYAEFTGGSRIKCAIGAERRDAVRNAAAAYEARL